jgi:hypothetical protein
MNRIAARRFLGRQAVGSMSRGEGWQPGLRRGWFEFGINGRKYEQD